MDRCKLRHYAAGGHIFRNKHTASLFLGSSLAERENWQCAPAPNTEHGGKNKAQKHDTIIYSWSVVCDWLNYIGVYQMNLDNTSNWKYQLPVRGPGKNATPTYERLAAGHNDAIMDSGESHKTWFSRTLMRANACEATSLIREQPRWEVRTCVCSIRTFFSARSKSRLIYAHTWHCVFISWEKFHLRAVKIYNLGSF